MRSKNMESIIGLADKANLLESDGIRKLLTTLSLDWDEGMAEDLEQVLMFKTLPRMVDNPFFPYPELNGKLKIGMTPSPNSWFGLTANQINQNLLIVGRSGAGKTNLFYSLMTQFLEESIPFLAFDFKRDYRHLIKDYPNIIVIPWESFRYNPMKPPKGVTALRWMQIFCDVFCHSHALLSGSKNFLLKQVETLYEFYDVFDDSKNYPSFYELLEMLNIRRRSIRAKEAWYLGTVKNRVSATILTIKSMLDCETGFPLEQLLEKPVILELDGMAEDFQGFLVESILSWIYNYRLAQGHRGKLIHGIFFDEAKKIFDINKEKMPASGIPTIDIITDRAREFGEALIVADQEPSKLTDSIKANTYTKIMLSLGSGKDINIMAHCMGLSREQTAYAYKLKVGHGIVKLAGHRPFSITTSNMQVDKKITDKEVASNLNKILWKFPVLPRVRPDKFEEFLNGITETKKQDNNTDGYISGDAERLLISINTNPFISVSHRYESLRLSAYKGNKAKEEIISRKMVKEVEIDVGRKGGKPKIFELNESGEEYLKSKGHDTKKKEKGGIEHRYWQNKIKEYFESWDCKAHVELYIGKKSVDVVVICPNGKCIAIEIAMSSNYEIKNIIKDVNFGFDEVVTACKNSKIMGSIKKHAHHLFDKKELNKIRFCLVKDFIISEKTNGFGSNPFCLDKKKEK